MVVVGLPEDVVFGILIWLPVVSLLRCKAVCKSWRALIESSTFVTQHLQHGRSKRNHDGLIGRHVYNRSPTKTNCYYCYRVASGENYETCVDMNHPDWYPVSEITLRNSCDGIVCLHHKESGDVALWNPATKQFRPLPQSPVPLRPLVLTENVSYKDKNMMFPLLGFDVKTKDYKVVRIITHVTEEDEEEEEEDYDSTSCQVEVYNLSSDSWRIIHRGVLPVNFPIKFILPTPFPISNNGMCFWAVTDQTYYGGETLLLSFDLSDEVFGIMPLPGGVSTADTYGLDFLNDKIVCIIGIHAPGYYKWAVNPVMNTLEGNHRLVGLERLYHFQVWVLHEYGVEESWTKLYTVGPVDIFPRLLSNHGYSLLVLEYPDENCDADISLYDVITQEITNLHVQDIQHYHTVFLHYNQSLVSIQGAANRATCSVSRDRA